MALATTCPQCKTSFKVVPDQLKLRRGMVRCGVCQNIFSGIDFLRYVDDRVRQGGASAAAARQRGGDADAPTTLGGEDLRTAFFMPDTVFQPTASFDAPGTTARPNLPASLQAGYRGAVPAPASQPATPPADHRAAPPASASLPFEPVAPPAPAATIEQDAAHDGDAAAAPAIAHRAAIDAPATQIGAPSDARDATPSAQPTAEPVAHTPNPAAADAAAPAFVIDAPAGEPRAAQPHDTDRGARASHDAGTDHDTAVTRRAADAPAARVPDERGAPLGFSPTIVVPPAGAYDDQEIPTDFVPAPALRRGERGRERERARAADALSPATVLRAPAAEADDPPTAFGGAPAGAPEPDAIAMFSGDEGRPGFSSRVGAVGWIAAGVLTLALLLQLAVGLRAPLAGVLPEGGTAYARIVAPLAALYGPPRDLKQVTIESFELTAGQAPDSLALRALLRNQAGYPVQWPAMELTLTDSAGALLVRKVILPAEYLAGEPDGPRVGTEGIGPRAELPVRLALEARDLTPSGYSVNLFYP